MEFAAPLGANRAMSAPRRAIFHGRFERPMSVLYPIIFVARPDEWSCTKSVTESPRISIKKNHNQHIINVKGRSRTSRNMKKFEPLSLKTKLPEGCPSGSEHALMLRTSCPLDCRGNPSMIGKRSDEYLSIVPLPEVRSI